MEVGARAATERQTSGGASKESAATEEEGAASSNPPPARWVAREAAGTQPHLIARRTEPRLFLVF
jgi:hypothetical protein